MNTLKTILVAIKTPAARKQPALRKAAQLAAASGAKLELYHAISDPVYLDAFVLQGIPLEQIQQQWRSKIMKQLELHAAAVSADEGVHCGFSCEWDFPAYEAVVRRATKIRADLVVAERHATRHILPWLLRFNDWELLRRSPVPVLLIKKAQAWKKPAVLAAVDPSHSFAKPAGLDSDILATANMISTLLGGKLHAAHAYPGTLLPTDRLGAISAEMAANIERTAAKDARKTFAKTIDDAKLARVSKHLASGSAIEVIPQIVRRNRISVVVMGAISRSGLRRLVIGNVAEQVLDALPCDVLVVKPVNFKSPVRAKPRGVQLVSTPSMI
jgi:universal stress protein E